MILTTFEVRRTNMKESLTIEHDGSKFTLGFTLTDDELTPEFFPHSQPWDIFAVNFTELIRTGMMQFTALTGGSIKEYMYHARIHREKLTHEIDPLPMEIVDDSS